MNIILYSTGCPKCNILKKKLNAASINYIEETDVDVMMSLGITAVPMLKVDDKLLSYMDAVKLINDGGLK